MLRQALIYLRRQYNTNLARLLQVAGGALIACLIAGVLLDVFIPFSRWWNVLRTVVLIPETASIFTLAYTLGLHLHYRRENEQTDWVPYRLRFSLSVRRQIAAVGAALVLVFIYATSFGPGYTFMSSLLLALVIGLIAFIRPTKDEQTREEYNLPDARDVRYQREKAARLAARQEADEQKRARRRGKLQRALGTDERESNE